MQIKTFSITVDAPEEAEDSMNRFLRGHRILQIDRHFLDIGVASRWVYSVEYMEAQSKPTPEKAVGKTGRIDYSLFRRICGYFPELNSDFVPLH